MEFYFSSLFTFYAMQISRMKMAKKLNKFNWGKLFYIFFDLA